MTDLPRYDDLPNGSAWGVFGADDQIGTLNLAGAAEVLGAAGCVRTGEVFPLNWDVELPAPAILGRRDLQYTLLEDDVGRDDVYDRFYPQASSQWDGLTHVRHPQNGFYNGHPVGQDGAEPGVLGIHHWARRGIAGRFVLLDVAGHRAAQGRPIDCAQRVPIAVDELDEVVAAHGVELRPGDILLLRFGWIAWYETTGETERKRLREQLLFPSPGLDPAEDTARWLWDHRIAAVAADCPALEAMPFDQSHIDGFVHYRLIPMLGMAIGEMLALDALAAACRADSRWDGLITAAPINKVGGAGSPANAIAIR